MIDNETREILHVIARSLAAMTWQSLSAEIAAGPPALPTVLATQRFAALQSQMDKLTDAVIKMQRTRFEGGN